SHVRQTPPVEVGIDPGGQRGRGRAAGRRLPIRSADAITDPAAGGIVEAFVPNNLAPIGSDRGPSAGQHQGTGSRKNDAHLRVGVAVTPAVTRRRAGGNPQIGGVLEDLGDGRHLVVFPPGFYGAPAYAQDGWFIRVVMYGGGKRVHPSFFVIG